MAKKPATEPKSKSNQLVKNTIKHPPYLQMIMEAICSLKKKSGSSQPAIAKFIEEKYVTGLPLNFKKIISMRLKKFVKSEKLFKVKNSYKISVSGKSNAAQEIQVVVVEKKKKKSEDEICLLLGMAYLTDDILTDIFTYLPLISVYKLRCLSKVWLSNLSDPDFFTGWFQKNNHKSPPWIQCFENGECGAKFVCEHPEFMSRNEHLFSFKFLMNDEKLVPQGTLIDLIGSSNGLVLFRSDDYYSESRVQRFHVCNPLTRKWVSLPPPSPQYELRKFDVHAIFYDYSSSSYKVVRIPDLRGRVFFYEVNKFIVDVFSSDLGAWESFQVTCDDGSVEWDWDYSGKVVILNGVLFWVQRGIGARMLVYDLNQKNKSDQHRCNLIDLPQVEFEDVDSGSGGYASDLFLGKSEGRLCYALTKLTFETRMTVSVWVLDEVHWLLLHENISVDDVIPEVWARDGSQRIIKPLGFSPVDRNVVFLGREHLFWGFNIKTRCATELCLDNRYDAAVSCPISFVLKPRPTVLPPSSWKRVENSAPKAAGNEPLPEEDPSNHGLTVIS